MGKRVCVLVFGSNVSRWIFLVEWVGVSGDLSSGVDTHGSGIRDLGDISRVLDTKHITDSAESVLSGCDSANIINWSNFDFVSKFDHLIISRKDSAFMSRKWEMGDGGQ